MPRPGKLKNCKCAVCCCTTQLGCYICVPCVLLRRRLASPVFRARDGAGKAPPGHEQRIDLYARRAALGLPLFTLTREAL